LKLIIAALAKELCRSVRQSLDFLWAKDKDAFAGSLACGHTKHHPTTKLSEVSSSQGQSSHQGTERGIRRETPLASQLQLQETI